MIISRTIPPFLSRECSWACCQNALDVAADKHTGGSGGVRWRDVRIIRRESHLRFPPPVPSTSNTPQIQAVSTALMFLWLDLFWRHDPITRDHVEDVEDEPATPPVGGGAQTAALSGGGEEREVTSTGAALQEGHHPAPVVGETTTTVLPEAETRGFLAIFLDIWRFALAGWLSLVVTFALFPSVFWFHWQREFASEKWNAQYVPIMFVIAVVGEFVGRALPGMFGLPDQKWIVPITVLRTFFFLSTAYALMFVGGFFEGGGKMFCCFQFRIYTHTVGDVFVRRTECSYFVGYRTAGGRVRGSMRRNVG